MADDFDWENKQSKPPDRARELLRVAERTMVPEAGPVVIQKRQDRASQGHARMARWRLERGNQTDQVSEEDKDRDASDHRKTARASMPHVVIEQVSNAQSHRVRDEELHDLLNGSGLIH